MQIDSHSLASIQELYDKGLYLQGYQATKQFGSLTEWTGTAARLLASRLARQLSAPRLANWHLLKAYREAPDDAEAIYYYAWYVMERRGPYAAWQLLKQFSDTPNAPIDTQVSWYTLRGQIAGMFRDFETAENWLSQAQSIAPDSAWVHHSLAWVRHQEDRYQEAYELLQQALALRPWYCPAILGAAHMLTLLNQDDEALTLLQEAIKHLESSLVVIQLVRLQIEHEQYEKAHQNLNRLINLMPIKEKNMVQWLASLQSNVAYFLDDMEAAIEYAQQVNDPYYDKIATHLEHSRDQPSQRKVLPVGFVRQHHMTCAPATLSAISHYWDMPAEHLQIAEEICYYGTSAYNERRWAEENGWFVREFTVTQANATTLIDNNIPFTLATVDLGTAHLQAVVGYDNRRQTLLIRDPFMRHSREALVAELLQRYAATGPRGMALVPKQEQESLQAIDLPDTALWDLLHQFDAALESHRGDEAQVILDNLTTQAPEHRLTLEGQYRWAVYNGNPVAMLSAVEALLRLYPQDERLQLARVNYLKDLAHRADLLEAYKQLCQRKDAHPIFWQEYAQELSFDARTHDEAIFMLRRAISRWPTKESIYFTLAKILWAQRQFEAALELYRFATCLNDKDEHLAQAYFTAAQLQNQDDTALEFLKRRQQRLQRNSNLPARTLAWAYGRLNQRVESLQVVEDALALWPDDGDMLLYAADAFAHTTSDHHERANTLLQQAKNKAVRVYWLRTAARVTVMMGDLAEALDLWQQVLAIQPLALDAHQIIVDLLAKTQGREAALRHLQATADAFPHHHPLHRLWISWLGDEPPTVADPVFRRVLDMNPADAWVHRQYGYWLIDQRRFEDASVMLQAAQELDPVHSDYHHLHGVLLHRQGNLDEAKEAFRQAISLANDIDRSVAELLNCCSTMTEQRDALTFIWQQLMEKVIWGEGMLMYRAHAIRLFDAETLLTQLRQALDARPELWHTWSACVLQLLQVNQLDEARELARQATQRFPFTPRVWTDLAYVCRVQMDGEGEYNALETAYRINPHWERVVLMLCGVHERRGEWSQSKELLEQAISWDPLNVSYHGALARVFWHLGDQATAIERTQYALTLDPGYDWAWNNLRDWSQQIQKPDVITETARQLTTRRSHEARSWFLLARMLPKPEDVEERLQALQKAIEYNPRLIQAYDLQAQTLVQMGRIDEAKQACQAIVWQEHIPSQLRIRAAWIELQVGQVQKAIQLMCQLLDEDPNNYDGWATLADWYRERKYWKRYLEAAEALVRLSPHNAVSLGYLGEARLRLGKEAEAKDAFARAFSLDPHYLFAGYNLFDMFFKEGALEQAAEIVTLLQQHDTSPFSLARAVQLAAKQGDETKACDGLRQLCVMPQENQWPLQTAVKSMVEAKWGKIVDDILEEALDSPQAQPEVGTIWMERRAVIKDWPPAAKLQQLARQGEAGGRATYTFLVSQARLKNGRRLVHTFLKQNQEWLRANTYTWGSVGYALTLIQDYRAIPKWMADWQNHTEAQPWMLLNLVEGLHFTAQAAEAKRVSQYALTRPPDHCTPYHELWLALDDALAGNFALGQQCLSKINPDRLSPSFLFLFRLLQAVMTMSQTTSDNRAQDFKLVRKQIHLSIKSYNVRQQTGKSRLFIYRACLKKIAELRGGILVQVWRWGYHFAHLLITYS